MGRLAEQQNTSGSVSSVSSSSSTQFANDFKAILSACFGSALKFKQSSHVRTIVHVVARTAEVGSTLSCLSVPSKMKLHCYRLSNTDKPRQNLLTPESKITYSSIHT